MGIAWKLANVVAVSQHDQILLMSTAVQDLKEYCCNCSRVRLDALVIAIITDLTATEIRDY